MLCATAPLLGAQARPAAAGEPAAPANVVTLDGLDIEFDDAGAWTRMSATYRQPVAFPDRQGLRTAYTIAEEKGKAQLVRYLEQNVSSERLVEEVDRATQQATREQDGAGSARLSRTAQREMVASVREFTRSYAQGTLRGVTVVEQGYDERAEEAWVKVGLTRASVRLASQLRRSLSDTAGVDGAERRRANGTSAPLTQPAEVRTRALP